MKILKYDNKQTSLRRIVEDLKTQQTQLVRSFEEDQHTSCQRVSDALSDLELYAAKLQTVVRRLDNITETLVQESDARVKPWYIRIFCPYS
ncbi:EsV-1-127 [Ectocarpus siliculosus]|uniref:EsV-1-127 n=1 Tax=Ectocarpus siliculosus TaxID=2880 RepID=D8LPF3_ECTSI|nr:EsV-1-127 [Ectocarpus siliculosus]|eukprot:CBN80425.1 EsV-1-127 [Ectocarpus siliculosus]